MLTIRLTRVGKKNSPSYRVVVADKKRAVKRKFIEIIGNYNPTLTPKQLVIDKDRALFWIERGAQPSDTVNNLMVKLKILAEDKKIMKIYGKKLSKKAVKEGPKKPEVDQPEGSPSGRPNEPQKDEVAQETEGVATETAETEPEVVETTDVAETASEVTESEKEEVAEEEKVSPVEEKSTKSK